MREINNTIVLGFMVICSVSDLQTRRVSTALLVGMSSFVGIYAAFFSRESVIEMIGGVGIGMLFIGISKATKEALGYGDSWIILLLGGYLGGLIVLKIILFSFVFAGLFSLAGIIVRKWKRTAVIPFIPFLTVAYVGVVML